MRISTLLLGILVGCAGSEDSDVAIDGATVYDDNCVVCHGADGDQGTEVNGTAAADLNTAVPGLSDEELAAVITDGEGSMSAVAGVADNELDPLIEFLREKFPE